jgi:hypothetical protein
MENKTKQLIFKTILAKAVKIIDKQMSINIEYRFNDIPNDKIAQVMKCYEDIKSVVKSEISNEDFKQDRHKIASAFIISILKNKPVSVDLHPKAINKEEATYWINMILAVEFAQYMIFSFPKPYETYNEKLFKCEKNQNRYTNDKEYEDYLFDIIYHICEDIDKCKNNDSAKLTNYILSLSHILYLLEIFTLHNQLEKRYFKPSY